MPGPLDFDQPTYGDFPVLDGKKLSASYSLQRNPQSSGAHFIVTGSGGSIIQLTNLQTNTSLIQTTYSWSWIEEADDSEQDWNLLSELASIGNSVWFIPYDFVTSVFITKAGNNNYELRRFIAESKYPSFESTVYPHRAWLDGVPQTIVGTGPSSGEILLLNDKLSTPSDVLAGKRLVVNFYPAYAVFIPLFTENFQDLSSRSRNIIATETLLQLPS